MYYVLQIIYFSDDDEPRAKMRKDTTMTEKIIDNFRVHLGTNSYVEDIQKAIKDVAKRDYPCLDWDKIPPIIVPCLFLPTNCPEVIDYEKYISEIENAKRLKNLQEEGRNLTAEELELVNRYETVKNLEHAKGEFAEKEAYKFLQHCIKGEEVIVINNFKIMSPEDLEEAVRDFEKDFLIVNLSKRYLMALEVKSDCHQSSLKSAKDQIFGSEKKKGTKELVEKWCGANFNEENGWFFLSAIYFQRKPEDVHFCDECTKFIIIGSEFKDKFTQITESIPDPAPNTEASARVEFKKVASSLFFLVSSEPVVTPAKITRKVEKVVDKAGTAENIILWNEIFCLTPNQLSLLKDQSLTRVLFLSPPSCGKTWMMKAKARQLGLKDQKVLILLPSYAVTYHTLLFFQLQHEFEDNSYVHVDNVKADGFFSIDKSDLMDKLEKYKDHHFIMDEVSIRSDSDIDLIKRMSEKCHTNLCWVTVTSIDSKDLERKLPSMSRFRIIKDELQLPLRNTASIVAQAYEIDLGNLKY